MSQPTASPRATDLAQLKLTSRRIAYFSMEIALDPAIPTYSGGLGMLAGDTLRSAADTAAPIVAVSLAHRRGYFRQHLDAVGQQTETDVPWSPETTLPSAQQVVKLTMQGRRDRHLRMAIRCRRRGRIHRSRLPARYRCRGQRPLRPPSHRPPLRWRYLLPSLSGDGARPRRSRAVQGARHQARCLPHERGPRRSARRRPAGGSPHGRAAGEGDRRGHLRPSPSDASSPRTRPVPPVTTSSASTRCTPSSARSAASVIERSERCTTTCST